MRRLARFLLPLIVFFAFFLFPFSTSHAQVLNSSTMLNTEPGVPTNLHTITQSVILEVLTGFTCQVIGEDPTTFSHQCLGFNPTTGKIGYAPSNGGAVGAVSSMIAALYKPQTNVSDYFQYEAGNFGLVKHAYAANGIGFEKLSPILNLWTTFRNIAYFAFVIVFIAIGFAIMFRVKIDPRTVMTIENQIPKIIVGLLLVTFSYAIAGFLIDMMYVSTYLTVNVISGSQQSNPDLVNHIKNAEKTDLASGNPFGFVDHFIPGGILAISLGSAVGTDKILNNLFTSTGTNNKDSTAIKNGIVDGAITGTVLGAGTGLVACGIAALATAGFAFFPCALVATVAGTAIGAGTGAATSGGVDIATTVKNALGDTIAFLASVLAFLIIAIAILVALFRLWFSLLIAYVTILLDVVFSPFFIVAGVFPGSKIGFGMWLREIGSNLLAFPVTVAMFLLTGVFMSAFANNANGIFIPPLIGDPQGAAGQSPFAYLIALGMILLTPNVVSIMRDLLKAPQSKYLQTIITSLGAGATPLGVATKSVIAYNSKDLMGKSLRWRGVLQALGL